MHRTVKKIIFNILYGIAAVAIVLIIWTVAAAAVGTKFILPDIGTTFGALWKLLGGSAFWRALAFTLLRCLMSFAISLGIFFVLFFLCASFEPVRKTVEPLLAALRALPTLAVSLILALWAGGYYAPVALGVIVIVPYLYSAIKARNFTISKELAEVCSINGANKFQSFFSLKLPYAAAAFPESMASAFSFNVKVVVSAEILVNTVSSLGTMMNIANGVFDTARLIALVFCTVLVSVIFELVIKNVLALLLRRFAD